MSRKGSREAMVRLCQGELSKSAIACPPDVTNYLRASHAPALMALMLHDVILQEMLISGNAYIILCRVVICTGSNVVSVLQRPPWKVLWHSAVEPDHYSSLMQTTRSSIMVSRDR